MDVTQAERGVGGDNGLTGNRFSCQSLITPMTMRYVYAAIFFSANIVAWVERENPITYFSRQRRSGCSHHDCYAAEGVLTISFAYFVSSIFLFFFDPNKHLIWFPSTCDDGLNKISSSFPL